MPIIGLTDRTPSFKEIGRLRLGITKKEALVSGPKEIGYFRPDFRPDAMSAAQDFAEIYGTAPTEIHFRLPFQEIPRCWDAYYMAYNKTGLLGMADGERWLYLRNNKTGELIVKDGLPQDFTDKPTDASGIPYLPFDKSIPVYSYKNKNGQDVPVYAKPEGRLKILIPELKRAAFITVITHSIYNVIKLSEQLAGIEQVAKTAGMNLPMIPMVLSRRKEMISVSINGQKAMQEHYLLNIEIDPAWMEAQFRFLDTILPGESQPKQFELPAYIPTVQEVTEDEGPEIPEGQDLNDEELDQHMRELHEESQSEQTKAVETSAQPASDNPFIPPALSHLSGICSDDGTPYPLIPTDKLSFMFNSLEKALKQNNLEPEVKREKTIKRDAAQEIMTWRKANPAA